MNIKLWLVRAGALLLSILFIAVFSTLGKTRGIDSPDQATNLLSNLNALWNIGVLVTGIMIYSQIVSFFKSKMNVAKFLLLPTFLVLPVLILGLFLILYIHNNSLRNSIKTRSEGQTTLQECSYLVGLYKTKNELELKSCFDKMKITDYTELYSDKNRNVVAIWEELREKYDTRSQEQKDIDQKALDEYVERAIDELENPKI